MIQISLSELIMMVTSFIIGCLISWIFTRRTSLLPILPAYFDKKFSDLDKSMRGLIDTLAAQAAFIELLEDRIQGMMHENRVLRTLRDGYVAKYDVLKEQNVCLQDSIEALSKRGDK